MRYVAGLIFAVSCFLLFAGSANAQSMGYSVRGYPGRQDPQVNVYLSQRYDHLLQVSPGFRHYRMWKECRPITWPGLRASCIASFNQYEPLLVADYGYRPRWGHHWRHIHWWGHHWRHHHRWGHHWR